MRVTRSATRHEILIAYPTGTSQLEAGEPLTRTGNAEHANALERSTRLRALGIPHDIVTFEPADYRAWLGSAADTDQARELWARTRVSRRSRP